MEQRLEEIKKSDKLIAFCFEGINLLSMRVFNLEHIMRR